MGDLRKCGEVGDAEIGVGIKENLVHMGVAKQNNDV